MIATQTLSSLRSYDAFGNAMSASRPPPGAGSFAWRGAEGSVYDAHPTLVYMQARHYDPTIGRFIQPDSLALASMTTQGMNRYIYCENDPVNHTDPTGRSPLVLLIVGVLISGLVSGLLGAFRGGGWRGFWAGAAGGAATTALAILLTPTIGPILAGAFAGGYGAGITARIEGGDTRRAFLAGLYVGGILGLIGSGFNLDEITDIFGPDHLALWLFGLDISLVTDCFLSFNDRSEDSEDHAMSASGPLIYASPYSRSVQIV